MNGEKTIDAKKMIRIFIIGTQGTGKTSLLAGLAVFAAPASNAKITITPADSRTASYMSELAKALRKGMWPASTTRTEICKVNIIHENLNIEFLFLDYPGEELKTALLSLDEKNFQEIYEYLRLATYHFVIIDPEMIRNREAGPDLAKIDKIEALFIAINEVAKERNLKIQKQKKLVDGGIILTKADTIRELESQSAKECFLNSLPQVDEKLKLHFNHMAYFAVSATGQCREEILENGNVRRYPDSNALNPYGYDEIFDWIQKREISKARRKQTLISGIVLSILVAGTLVYKIYAEFETYRQIVILKNSTIPVCERLKQTSASRSTEVIAERLKLVDQETERLQEIIDKADSEKDLVYSEEIACLIGLKLPSKRDKLEKLSEKEKEKKRKLLLTLCEDAKETKNVDLCKSLANRILREYPESKEAGDARIILAELANDEFEKRRATIKAMLTNSPLELRNKSLEIKRFLDEFGASPKLTEFDVKQMRRAVELGNQFCERKTYEITVVKSGDFTKSAWHKIEVITKDGNSNVITSSQHAKEYDWSNGKLKLEWASGDPIDVRFHADDSNFSAYSLVGLTKDTRPIALNSFKSRHRFNVTPGWEGHVNNAYVDFKVEGITDDDWKAVEGYLSPGGAW